MTRVVEETALTQVPLLRRGKVRDIYDLGDRLLLVATDRVSAFDHVLPTAIPDKGRVLTQLSEFWFRRTADLVPNHLVSTDIAALPESLQGESALLAGRTMLVRRTTPVEVECVVRGYLCGSAWKEYQAEGRVAGEPLPRGLVQFGKLDRPVFTPAIKRHAGHDENISFRDLKGLVGRRVAGQLRDSSLAVYERGLEHCRGRGFLLADAKFEFGHEGRALLLIDEVLTPDSSRFWAAETWAAGREPDSADKQIVRDYLVSIGWDGTLPVPALPTAVVERVRAQYLEILRRITDRDLG